MLGSYPMPVDGLVRPPQTQYETPTARYTAARRWKPQSHQSQWGPCRFPSTSGTDLDIADNGDGWPGARSERHV